MVWVDGRAFGRPDRLIFRGRGTRAPDRACSTPSRTRRTSTGSGCARARACAISANPAGDDDVALTVHRRTATRLSSRPLKRSARPREAHRAITLRNRSGRARMFYVGVRVQRGARDLDAGYALRVG